MAIAATAHGSQDALAQRQSSYRLLASDATVIGHTVLLASRVTLARADSVFVSADGSYAPLSGTSAGEIFVQADRKRVTNESSIDWRVIPNPWAVPVRHSFSAVGGTTTSDSRPNDGVSGRLD